MEILKKIILTTSSLASVLFLPYSTHFEFRIEHPPENNSHWVDLKAWILTVLLAKISLFSHLPTLPVRHQFSWICFVHGWRSVCGWICESISSFEWILSEFRVNWKNFEWIVFFLLVQMCFCNLGLRYSWGSFHLKDN